jgi:hypothetical protein
MDALHGQESGTFLEDGSILHDVKMQISSSPSGFTGIMHQTVMMYFPDQSDVFHSCVIYTTRQSYLFLNRKLSGRSS